MEHRTLSSHDDRVSSAHASSLLSSVYRSAAAPAAVNGRQTLPSSNKNSHSTPNLSSRSSSGSSSTEALHTPSISPSNTVVDVKPTPLTALRRQQVAKAASSASASPASARMMADNFDPQSVNVGATSSSSSSSSSKTNRILGPDDKLYTQGDAAKLGLIIRTACEACRNRKLKCSGTLPENGGCARCNSDGIQCVYSARAPIGRPKKRKLQDTPDSTAASPSKSSAASASAKPKASRKHSATNSLADVSASVKTEHATPFASPASSQAALSFASSPALQHVHHSAAYVSCQASLTVSPAQSDKLQQRQDATSAAFVTPHPPFGVYGSPMHAPAVPESSSSSSRLVSTPTVWSQNPAAFAMTPSDPATTPQSIISPAVASTAYLDAQHTQHSASNSINAAAAAKLPSLDDLSVAAFLQSLDTLEISPAELFQQRQQQQQQQHVQPFSGATSSSGTSTAANAYALGTPFNESAAGVSMTSDQLPASSLEEWATSSAILQPGLSFAVPADFSWWDLGINRVDLGAGSAAASVSATPSTELGSMAFPSSGGGVQPQLPVANDPQRQDSNSAIDGASVVGASSSAATSSHRSEHSHRPTFSVDQMWPRGADAGMGQGQIQHAVAAIETGLGWSTLPAPSQLAEALSSPVENSQTARNAGGRGGSCCSGKSAMTAPLSLIDVKGDQSAEVGEAEKAPCCSSKSIKQTTETKQLASCCAGEGDKPAVEKEESKSCCSGPATSPSSAATSTSAGGAIEMGPLSTSAAIHGTALARLDHQHKRLAHTHHPSKVHCVPNPSGKGCTCLCDMSVALLSVKQVLRDTSPCATDTIQLTLTASQAITAQCACSADCPTCQSDPSTEISASLLVSTALQIYARAVRILREGLSAAAKNGEGEAEGEGAGKGFFGGLDVTIGTYKPSAGNAKRIALYAIKLELKDLRRALGKVSRMAQNLGVSTPARGEAVVDKVPDGAEAETEKRDQAEKRKQAQGQGMNPIDQLVILKLYRQLTELLKTIEGLEDAA